MLAGRDRAGTTRECQHSGYACLVWCVQAHGTWWCCCCVVCARSEKEERHKCTCAQVHECTSARAGNLAAAKAHAKVAKHAARTATIIMSRVRTPEYQVALPTSAPGVVCTGPPRALRRASRSERLMPHTRAQEKSARTGLYAGSPRQVHGIWFRYIDIR